MDFNKAFEILIEAEGGYVNDPQDNGGATNYGITRNTLSDWLGRPVTNDDVRNLALEEARAIYKKNYWNVVQCDKVPDWMKLHLFDAAVHSGPRTAAAWLQVAVGVKSDGVIGDITLAALAKKKDTEVLPVFVMQRLWLMGNHADFKRFGRGWCSRVVKITILSAKGD